VNHDEEAAGLAPTPGYRYAEVVGHRLLLAGQVPHDAEGHLVGLDDVARQTDQCLTNLRTVVAVHGFEWSDLRRLTVYVVGDHDALGVAWSRVVHAFEGTVPPATLLGVALLGHVGQLVEIDAHVERLPAA